ALRGESGQARERVGDRHVRQLADVLGRDRLDDGGGGALGLDGVLDAAADAGDGDAVQLGGVVGRGGGLFGRGLPVCGRAGVLRLCGGGDHQRRRGQRHAQQVAFHVQGVPSTTRNAGARTW